MGEAVFTVGTTVEVRLDNGEWASAVITAVKKPANCDNARSVPLDLCGAVQLE